MNEHIEFRKQVILALRERVLAALEADDADKFDEWICAYNNELEAQNAEDEK